MRFERSRPGRRTLRCSPRSIQLFSSLPVVRADHPLCRRRGYHARMTQWLRGRTLFHEVVLALMLLAEGAPIVSYCSGRAFTAEFGVLALILSYIAFRK